METRAKYAAGGIASVAASVGLVVAVAMSNSATLADVRGTAVGSGTVVVKATQRDAPASDAAASDATASDAVASGAESQAPAAETPIATTPIAEANGAVVAVSAASSEPGSQEQADQVKQPSTPASAYKSRSDDGAPAEKIEIVEQVVEKIRESRSDSTREPEGLRASNDRASSKSEKDRRDDNKTQSHVSPDRRD
ncbi:hypothetical protein [Microbacterium sp. NPDC076911]|uniref:hypothetical protein n=1 Tax=Microbacterium sp. NPDC076911 TaxID=3154958 RepID=UPI00342F1FCF